MIEFKNVTYQYPDGNRALDNINLKINTGEKVCVIGPNGSGKSSFALNINGILKPSSGSVKINNLDSNIAEDSQRLKQMVGMVFQNPDNQLVTMTVEREIAFSLENQNIERDRMSRRVNEILQFFNLTRHKNRLTAELSGGEKQKLALAAVLVTEPDILVLDEPDSYLDQSGKRILNDAIERLLEKKPELTIIRITQYPAIADLLDRLIIFKNGSIFREGKPEEIFSDKQVCKSANIEVPLKYRIKYDCAFISSEESSIQQEEVPAENPCFIKLNDVHFGYGKNPEENILENLNLEINNGKIYGLVGATGSGKSTLIQLLAGLLSPTNGKIRYEGLSKAPGSIGISFQLSERQFFLDTVEDEIIFGARNLNKTNLNEIVARCCQLVGLSREKFSKRDPFSLSGGEKRRLSFAAILSLDPIFLFFDEPTCGLDFDGVKLFKKLVFDLKQRGVGVIVISHEGNLIYDLADEILVLKDKQIQVNKSKYQFFQSDNYADFLSTPDFLSFQKDKFGAIKYFSESDLYNFMNQSNSTID